MSAKIYTGSFNVAENSAATVTVKDVAALASGFRQRISSCWIDGTNLTVDARLSVHLYMGAAGLTKCHIEQYDMIISAGVSVNLLEAPIEIDTRIVFEINSSGIGAAGPVTCYYRIPYDDSIDKVQSVFNGTGDVDDVDLYMRNLHILCDTGDAVHIESTGANGNGLNIKGNGTGHGALVESGAGATGDGLHVDSRATDGRGFACLGNGASHGIYCKSGGGLTGNGFHSLSIATNGHGFYSESNGTGHALNLYAPDTGNGININAAGGNGIDLDANGFGVILTSSTSVALEIEGKTHGILAYGETVGALFRGASESGGGGMIIQGDNAGNGLRIYSDDTGIGLKIEGGTTSGNAINVTTTDGHGLHIQPGGATKNCINLINGNYYGIYSSAFQGALYLGSSRIAMEVVSTGAAGSQAAYFHTTVGGAGIEVAASGGPGFDGIKSTGAGTGSGLLLVGGATGNGLLVQAAGADAAKFQATAGTGNGMSAYGFGTGNGLYLISGAGATGDGFHAESGATNGNGMYLLGRGTGDGAEFNKGSAGLDIDAEQLPGPPVVTMANLNRAFQTLAADLQLSNFTKNYVY